MGQGQPRVIVCIIFVVLAETMLQTKFQGHRSIGSGEEDFLFCFFPINGHGGHVGHVTQLIYINFHFFYFPSSFHMNFGSKSHNCF